MFKQATADKLKTTVAHARAAWHGQANVDIGLVSKLAVFHILIIALANYTVLGFQSLVQHVEF